MVAHFGAPQATAALLALETMGRESRFAGSDVALERAQRELDRLAQALLTLLRDAA
jgi:hypothetical protein